MDMDSSEDFCWICLDDASKPGAQQLINPCRCPRKVHPCCLARWQLQQAGRAEETRCRFCDSTLADWKHSLTPEPLKPEVERVQPVMVVYFEGTIQRIPVKQGSDGLQEFTTRIRDLFRLPEDVDISLTFGCKEPMSGQHLKLEGMGAFDAAVHCASVAAAERQHKLRSTGGGSGGGGDESGTASGGASEASAGGGSSSGGSTHSSASAPSTAPSSNQAGQADGTSHRSATHLRHSTGSAWPTAGAPPSTGSAAPSDDVVATQWPVQADDADASLGSPTPFAQSPAFWADTSAPLAPPLMLDDHLLTEEHHHHWQQSGQAGHLPPPQASAFSPAAESSWQPGPQPLGPRQAQAPLALAHPLATHSSLGVPPGGFPHLLGQGAHTHQASLMSLLSSPSLSSHVPSRITSTSPGGPGATALSSDNLVLGALKATAVAANTSLFPQVHAPCSQQHRLSTMAVDHYDEPCTPPNFNNSVGSVDGVDSDAATPGTCNPGRRARRTFSHVGAVPQPHYDGVNPDMEDGPKCEECGRGVSAEATAWATSLTVKLRSSLKVLSKRVVRCMNSFAQRSPQALGGVVTARDLHTASLEATHCRLDQQSNVLKA